MQGETFFKNTYPKMLGRYSWVNGEDLGL